MWLKDEFKDVRAIAGLSFWPLVVLMLNGLLAPGYIIPFLNHPIGRLMAMFGCVWLVPGFFVMRRFPRLWQITLAQIAFTIPVLLIFMLGPATIGIFSALGPILSQ